MTTQQIENPPAFPTKRNVHDPRADGFITEEGMTLRDYFAAKAMQGVASNPELLPGSVEEFDSAATRCYQWADAMLKARLS